MGKKLFVGNLSYNASEQGVADLFAQCGAIDSVKIITDRETGRSKGFAFVEMTNDNEATEAISKLHGSSFEGRNLVVNEARPQEPRREGGFGGGRGGGGRGGFGGGGPRRGGGFGGGPRSRE